MNKYSKKIGFTLIEVLISIFIFAILSVAVAKIFFAIDNGIIDYREKTTISALADQYLEIARNLPYVQIGTLSGNPHGNLPDFPNALNITFNKNNYKIYYVVNYIDDPADGTALLGTDSAPNDYKQIKLYVKNITTDTTNSFTTNAIPKGLEGLNGGGALFIKVFNAVGQPVPGATIQITNNTISPSINLTRTADTSGNWIEVGLPNSANSYHIVVNKNGYSADQTYQSTSQNPNPTKADATISSGQVTQISFSIDQLSSLVFNAFSQTCGAIQGVGLEVRGSKLIGTPSLLKFDNNYSSDANGNISLSNIEWDSYTPALTGITYMIYGSSPIQSAVVLPNTNQIFTLLLGPKTTNSLLVIVKDASNGNPIEGANVDLQTISPASDTNKITGGSVWSQQSWAGGWGQANFSDVTKYYQDDGNISNNGVPSGLRLAKVGNSYAISGVLTSSTFGTGTDETSYTTLNWQPTSQDPTASIKFQIATNNDNATWNFIGPDGTSNTYYNTPGTTISSANNNNRYVRYKAFLSTTDTSKTPVLTSVNINYVSGCFAPGQVIFPGLQASSSNYKVIISMLGYQTQTISSINIGGYNILQISLYLTGANCVEDCSIASHGACVAKSAGKYDLPACTYCDGSSLTSVNEPAGSDVYNECTASYNNCLGNNKIGPDGNCNGFGGCNTTGMTPVACTTAGICQAGGGCSGGSCIAVSSVPNGQQGNGCVAAHYVCNGTGSCIAPTTTTCPSYSNASLLPSCANHCSADYGNKYISCLGVFWTSACAATSTADCSVGFIGPVHCQCYNYVY